MQRHPVTVRRLTELDLDVARKALTEVNARVANEVALQEFLRDLACYVLVADSNGAPVGALNGYALRRPYGVEPQFLL